MERSGYQASASCRVSDAPSVELDQLMLPDLTPHQSQKASCRLSHRRLRAGCGCRSYRFHSCEILVSSKCGGPFFEISLQLWKGSRHGKTTELSGHGKLEGRGLIGMVMSSVPPHHCPSSHLVPLLTGSSFGLGFLPFPPSQGIPGDYSSHLVSSPISNLTAQPTAIWFHPHHATEIILVNVTSEDV